MKDKRFVKALFFLLAALLALACSAISGGGEAPAAQPPAPAVTEPPTEVPPPAASDTPVPPPTKTPLPKPTDTAAPPTPSQLGEVARSQNFEVTVIAAEKRDRVYPGGKFYYTANPGYMLIDVGVKVVNISGSSLDVKWKDVYVMRENGDWWYPTWGTFKTSLDKLDPFSIGVSEVEIDPEAVITVGNKDGYLRLFFLVEEEAAFYFGFGDSPLTEMRFK